MWVPLFNHHVELGRKDVLVQSEVPEVAAITVNTCCVHLESYFHLVSQYK